MLLTNQPAKFITFLYHDIPVRIHLHTDDQSIWVVAKDFCKVIHRTNPSFFVSKLNKDSIKKHLIKTKQGPQRVLWIKVQDLDNLEDTLYLGEFLLWIKQTVNTQLEGSNSNIKVFKNPVIVEKQDLEDLLKIVNKLYQNLSL